MSLNKYVFVTGGVCSSLGKGVAASSLAALLETRGLSIRMIKIDPYLNVDAGTMSPFQHGEVFVTDDGAETDLDLGNYERFTNSPLSAANSITTGQVYDHVIRKEREGKYLGKCVQVVPHITDEIKRRIYSIGNKKDVDVTVVEVGGTIGDIESIPFLEAVRQIIHEKGQKGAISVHLSLLPEVGAGEVKTKPTQHTVKAMREIGIQPQVLLCRCNDKMSEEHKRKISMFTNIDEEAVISAHNAAGTIYGVPVAYHAEGLDSVVLKKMGVRGKEQELGPWQRVADVFDKAKTEINVAFVGKYIQLEDAYKSIDEALVHGGIANKVKVKFNKIDSEKLEKLSDDELHEVFADADCIHIPGGFGSRGVLGMIIAAKYARENKIPFFGICLGVQVLVMEYARNVLGYEDADSTEFRPYTEHPVVALLEDQVDVTQYGGTMRLGLNESFLVKDTNMYKAYGKKAIAERHRHRYEVANKYREELANAGLIFSGTTLDGELVECAEWPDHPWGVGVQFHPEFTSKPTAPGPLFRDFIKAAVKYKDSKEA